MKTKTLSAFIIAGLMAAGTTVTAQDTLKTKGNTIRSKMRQEVPKKMKAMDTDGDGMVSMEEAKAAKDQKFYKDFKKADTSRDGMVDVKEFMAYQKKMKKGGMDDKDMDPMKKKDSTDN